MKRISIPNLLRSQLFSEAFAVNVWVVQTSNFSWGIIRIKADPNYLDRLNWFTLRSQFQSSKIQKEKNAHFGQTACKIRYNNSLIKFGVWSGPKNCLGENISLNQTKQLFLDFLTFEVPMVTNINFLLTISIHCQEIRLWELINDHLRENALIFYQILSTHSLIKCLENSLENFCVYWGLNG